MCKRARWLGRALALLAVCSFGLCSVVAAAEGQEEKTLDLFKKGVMSYQVGDYAKAKDAFDQVLAMEPGMQTALKMRDMAELGQFVEMKQNSELALDATRLLDLMMRAVREQRREVPNADQLVADLQSPDLSVYGKAMAEFRGHGPYSVPYVLPLLSLKDPDKQLIVGRAVSLVAGLGPDTCLPLIQALQNTDDSLLKDRVAGVLGQLSDKRALAALTAAAQDPQSLASTREAADKAVQAITGSPLEAAGKAVDQYVALAKAYFEEQKPLVGYTWGMNADVWTWNAAGATIAQKLTYAQVPNYLYFQCMAADTAEQGLKLEAGNSQLQALLAASLVRQLVLCENMKSADVADEAKQEAQKLADKLNGQVPVVLGLLKAPEVALALQMALDVDDSAAALRLTKALGQKLAAAGPAAPDAATTVPALVSSLESGLKEARYNAAIVLVGACPTGTDVPADRVVAVLDAALKAATMRNALVIMDNLQMRNSLAVDLGAQSVATVESRVHGGSIESVLAVEPSVDVIFLSANVKDVVFENVMKLLTTDARTKSIPLYVVADPAAEHANLTDYTSIKGVLTPDDLRPEKLIPILQPVMAQGNPAFTEENAALVSRAVRALSRVNPLQTAYPLQVLEPSLILALKRYNERVTGGVVNVLARMGSPASLSALGEVVAGNGPENLKVAACRALAAIMKRTAAPAPADVIKALQAALAGDVPALRAAAAEALGVSGLSADEILHLVRTAGLGEE